MPRHGLEIARPTGGRRPERLMRSADRKPPANVDEQALSLGEADASYSTIAGRLELHRTTDAHRAFIRALVARTGEAQRLLVANEQGRLDTLETRIRTRDAQDPDKLERRLAPMTKLRASLP
jgi:hypothetical protein